MAKGFSAVKYKTSSGVTRGGGGGRIVPDDTLQRGDTQTKKIVGEFTKNSGQTRSDR